MINWGYMNISNKYTIKLSARERRHLKGIMRKGTHQAQVHKRAAVLLKSDEGMKDDDIAHHVGMSIRNISRGMKDDDIAHHVGMSIRNISRIRKRCVTGGLDRALHDAPRSGAPATVTMAAEAHLVAIACTAPPVGATHWSLELLREKMLKDKVVEHISTVAIWHHLNDRGIKPWREKNVGDPDPHSRVH